MMPEEYKRIWEEHDMISEEFKRIWKEMEELEPLTPPPPEKSEE